MAKSSPALFAGAANQDVALGADADVQDDDIIVADSVKPTRALSARSKGANNQARKVMAALEAIDFKLRALAADTEKDEVEKVLDKQGLLEEKMTVISIASTSISEEVVQVVFQAVHDHRAVIEKLFEEKALAGDLTAGKKLGVYVDYIGAYFLYTVIFYLHVDVCEYILQEFPESVFYLNFVVLGEDDDSYAILFMLLLLVFQKIDPFSDRERVLRMFEVLLKYGGDSNHNGTRSTSDDGTLLQMAIRYNLVEFVEVLLRYGADVRLLEVVPREQRNVKFNELKGRSIQSLSREFKKRSIRTDRSGASSDVKKSESSSSFSLIQLALLRVSVSELNNPKIILEMLKLLIAYGAPLEVHPIFGTIISWVTGGGVNSSVNISIKVQDPRILRLLADAGVDLDGAVGSDPLHSATPLEHLILRGDIKTALALILAGADPNAPVTSRCILSGNDVAVQSTVYGFAAFEIPALGGALVPVAKRIAGSLLRSTEHPVTFQTYLNTMAMYFIIDKNDFAIDDVCLKNQIFPDARNEKLVELSEQAERLAVTDDERVLAADEMLKRAKFHFSVQQYEVAAGFFSVVSWAGNDEQRHESCFYAARCLEHLGSGREASIYYRLAANFNARYDIAAQARVALIANLERQIAGLEGEIVSNEAFGASSP